MKALCTITVYMTLITSARMYDGKYNLDSLMHASDANTEIHASDALWRVACMGCLKLVVWCGMN